MTSEQAFAFMIFSAVAAVTPGPSNTMLTMAGARAGIVRGLACLFGVAAGMAAMMFAVAFGVGAVVIAQPLLLNAFKGLGAAFLLWLAWRMVSAREGAQAVDEAQPVGFFGAFAFQWLNPKSWLVSASASATYLLAGRGLLVQALWIASLFFLVALACGFVWLGFGAAVRRMLRSGRALRAFNRIMALLLVCSIALILR